MPAQTNENLPYRDRRHAGNVLADALTDTLGNAHHARLPTGDQANQDNLIVLALPRGGVPVAAVVAERLGAALDLILVRKLGLPGYEELAMGAIASGGARVLNKDVLSLHRVTEEAIERVAEKEGRELRRREQAYRGDRPFPRLSNRDVILVDDGLATGATMRAAIEVVRKQSPRRLIVAVPVAPRSTLESLAREVDELICPGVPDSFRAIGLWYQNFAQTSDEEVRELLGQAWQREGQPAANGQA